MTVEPAQGAKLNLGKIINETGGLIRQDLKAYVYLAGLLAVLPGAAMAILGSLLHLPDDRSSALDIILTLLGVILSAAVTLAAAARLKGEAPRTDACIQAGFRIFLPLLGLSLLTGLAVLAGLVLLVVPGLFLATMWAVVVPVLVLEKSKVFDSFRRSAELTRGRRLGILGLIGIYAMAVLLVALVLGLVSFVSEDIAAMVAGPIASGLIAVGGGVLMTVLYAELKQGVSGADV